MAKVGRKKMVKMLFESFIFGCCDTAARTFFVLPEGSNIFKKIGKEAICGVVAQKTADAVSGELCELYSAAKDVVNDLEEEEEKGAE